MIIELVGIFATVIILIAMSIKTTTYKGDVWMRIINLIGSAVFVVYGVLLPAISTAILNAALVVVNIVHLVILKKEHNKELQEKSNENKEKEA
ncbi:MAG: hypothetical protein IKD36_01895 [Clostridia bacterium]|nr:hypothetical protein [Clostridia bacterium]